MSKTSTRTPNSSGAGEIKVLGIDPGFDRVGVAVLQENNVLFSTCIETSKKLPMDERLFEIGTSIREIIKEWEPSHLAIEKLFFNKSVTSAMRVSEARGVAIYEAKSGGLEIFEYSPQDVKIAVASYGKADKKQVEMMVKKLVKITENGHKRLDDELDAIALCITHLATKKGI